LISVLKKQWFLLGIGVALLLGLLFSELGVMLNPESLVSTGLIIVLFFIAGFTLPSENILTDIADFRLHIFIQIFIFALVPAFFYATSFPFQDSMNGKLIIGIYAVACLPSTISSCIVFTQSSGGNVAATMVNTSLANVMGIFLSPLLLSLFLQSSGQALPPEEIMRILKSLGLKMFLPIGIGQVARLFFKDTAQQRKGILKKISNVCILFIIFFALSETASNPAFLHTVSQMGLPFLYIAVSHIVLVFIAFWGGKLFRFSRPDRITIIFTAPQKTLAMGAPLLTTYFSGSSDLLGIVLLPVIFYHTWQLIIAGVIKALYGRETG
jgi:sodium/bile acid cotransporter 7